jgi:hypothetical protein
MSRPVAALNLLDVKLPVCRLRLCVPGEVVKGAKVLLRQSPDDPPRTEAENHTYDDTARADGYRRFASQVARFVPEHINKRNLSQKQLVNREADQVYAGHSQAELQIVEAGGNENRGERVPESWRVSIFHRSCRPLPTEERACIVDERHCDNVTNRLLSKGIAPRRLQICCAALWSRPEHRTS